MATRSTGHPIMLFEDFDPEIVQVWLWGRNPCAPRVAHIYRNEAMRHGVDGLGAICQAVKETAYFTYKRPDGTPGNIGYDSKNPCGLGVTGPGKGQRFDTWDDGIRAHIQHLIAYASKDDLIEGILDERFHLVKRGSAPMWEMLGGKWAVPGYNTAEYLSFDHAFAAGETYGHSIIDYRNSLVEFIDNYKGGTNGPDEGEEPQKVVIKITIETDGAVTFK